MIFARRNPENEIKAGNFYFKVDENRLKEKPILMLAT